MPTTYPAIYFLHTTNDKWAFEKSQYLTRRGMKAETQHPTGNTDYNKAK